MSMIWFAGYMIPGIYFNSDYCVCIYRWKESNIDVKQMTEVWLVTPENKKICFIDPEAGIPLFKKYHNFDEIMAAKISVEEKANFIKVMVNENNETILEMEIATKQTIGDKIINLLLKADKTGKNNTKGKTETGKSFDNQPYQIVSITQAKLRYKDREHGGMIAPRKTIKYGDGSISKKPMVNYCKHTLEE